MIAKAIYCVNSIDVRDLNGIFTEIYVYVYKQNSVLAI